MARKGQSLPLWPVGLSGISRTGKQISIKANQAECARIAREFSLQEVASFEAEGKLTPWSAGGVKLECRLVADYVQSCVVTFAPVPGHIDERFSRRFFDPRRIRRAGMADERIQVDVTLEDDDPPEPLDGNSLDMGPILLEAFALALDPYPRAEGAGLGEPDGVREPGGGEGQKQSPFAVLHVLKPKP